MNTDYVVAAANEMFLTLASSPYPLLPSSTPAPDLIRVASVGCQTLRKIVEDNDFLSDMQRLAPQWQEQSSTFKSIHDVKNFVDQLMPLEKKVLSLGGLNSKLVRGIEKQAQESLDAIKAWGANPQRVMQQLQSLQDRVCSLSFALRDEKERAQDRADVKSLFKRWVFGIAGVASIGINASTLAVTLGLSAPGVALSGAIGAVLIDRAAG